MRELLIVLLLITAQVDFIRQAMPGVVVVGVSFYKDDIGWANETYVIADSPSAITAFKERMSDEKKRIGNLDKHWKPFDEVESIAIVNLTVGEWL